MVGRVAGLPEDFEAPPRPDRCRSHRPDEFLLADVCGAGGSDERSLTSQETNRRGMERLIGADRTLAFPLAFRQRGWIDDDEIKGPCRCLIHPGEGVGLLGLMPTRGNSGITLVEGEISPRRIQGMPTQVEVGHRGGAPTSGVQGKTTRETEGIQDLAPLGERLDPTAVLALIEEEPCLLTAEYIGFEAQTRFEEDDGTGRGNAMKHRTLLTRSRTLEISTEAQDETLGLPTSDNLFAEQRNPRKPGDRVEFQDESGVVAIEDQPRKAVALSVDEAEAGGGGIDEPFPPEMGLPETLAPETLVDQHWFSVVKDAHAEWRGGIVKSNRKKAVVSIIDHRQFPDFTLAILSADAVRIYPGMS